MKANLETVPKFRILFTREPGDDLTLPEELGAERQPDGGWHLWDNSEPFNGIVIPVEAVGPLVAILNGFDRYVTAPEPAAAPAAPPEWTYNSYRASLVRNGEFFSILTPNGTDALPKERVDILLAALNQTSAPPKPAIEPDPGFRIVAPGETIQMGDRWKFSGGDSYLVPDCVAGCPLSPHTSGIVLQRPIAPKSTVEPDPGYRRVVSGEVSRDGDLWKCPDGHTIPVTPGLVHCDQTSGAILQRLAPGAVAPGHNPDRLTVEQVGIAEGWRLLTPAEVKEFRCKEVVPAEFWATGWNSGCSWFVTSDSTLRTKAEKLEVVS